MADKQSADAGPRELALFAGAGGGILGGHLLGWRTVCAVEWDPYAASVLVARQNDGILSPFPIWDDVQTFDGKPWRGIVDVVSGGFPCQDISAAGRGAGIEGTRSGMWREMARVVSEVRPRFVFVENSPMLTTRGGARVIADLASLGYDTQWDVMGAADVGAPHQRDRIWIVAYSNGMRELQPERLKQDEWRWVGDCGKELADTNVPRRGQSNKEMAQQSSERFDGGGIQPRNDFSDANRERLQRRLQNGIVDSEGWQEPGLFGFTECSPERQRSGDCWWATEPDVGRVADRVAARVDRLKAIGNGQVPAVAAAAFRMLGVA